MIYSFGSFVLDVDQYRLARDQATIRVKPKALELLAYLIEHRERVVGKQELVSVVWNARFVSDRALTDAVYEARQALGDDGSKTVFIKTLHGRGYQFHYRPVRKASTERDSLPADGRFAYLLWSGGATPLLDGENVIGRDPEAVIVLDGLLVSRHHARVVVSQGEATLEDLSSKNGTLLNGVPATSPTALKDGDVITIGAVTFTFRVRLNTLSTMTERGH